MTDRVKKMRIELLQKLEKLETPGRWDHIIKQCGMGLGCGIARLNKRKSSSERTVGRGCGGRNDVGLTDTKDYKVVNE